MYKIKFGTDGWRAIIAKDYTVDNLKRVAEATARWMISKQMKKVVVGYDCRFGGQMFSEVTAQVFGHLGIQVVMSDSFVSTPMVSLAVVKTEADMGIVITASHNPPSYNGYKLKSAYGGPSVPSEIAEVESIIPDNPIGSVKALNVLIDEGLITYMDLEQMYIDHVEEHFEMDLIRSQVNLVYDAMYGAGQNVIRRLFQDAHLLHCDYNPSFMGRAPEPILRNLPEIGKVLASNDRYNLGLANDGDADRIGLFDESGRFVDSHHILLLLLMYMHEHKNLEGKIVITFSVTDKMEKLANHYGIDIETTKIGFKYIAEIMQNETVLVGGEESGGLAVAGHIPERDGIWIGLVIMEFMAKTGKSLQELIDDVHNLVGAFDFSRDDLHLEESKKQAIVQHCANGGITKIGESDVIKYENTDGHKYFLDGDRWVMIRPSGTEPVLRVYAQAPDMDEVKATLKDAHATLNAIA